MAREIKSLKTFSQFHREEIERQKANIHNPSQCREALLLIGQSLTALENCRMPVEEAHEIAGELDDLTAFLMRSDQHTLARRSDQVARNLRSRLAEGVEALGLRRRNATDDSIASV